LQTGWPAVLLGLLLAGGNWAETATAQDPAAATEPGDGVSDSAESTEPSESAAPQSFLEIVFSGGLTGVLIVMLLFGLSIAAAALVIEHVLTIRPSVLIPPPLPERVRQQLSGGSVTGADQACQAHRSLLAFVLRAGLAELDGGWPAVEKAMEDAIAEQAARLYRKIEYLSVIGNIAPMVGLLGTVVGMIFAFQEVAASQGAPRAADLAEGIYQALVTTVGGLLVAIPTVAAFAIFRNRVDQLVAEAAYKAQHAIAPLKRSLTRRVKARTPAPPPVEGGG